MKIKQIFIGLLVSMFGMSVHALPAAFNATYAVSKSGLNLGEMQVSLVYKDNVYRYYKSSKATGLAAWLSGDKIVEKAIGNIQGKNLQTTHYLYHHTSKRKNRKDQFQFVSPSLVKGNYKEKAYSLEVSNGTIDRATLELTLARDMAQKKKDLGYSVVERGKLKDYRLRRLGQEKIKIAGKEYLAEKLIVERDTTKRKTTFWLAKELDYLPVKIDHIEKGDPVVTHLKSIKFLK